MGPKCASVWIGTHQESFAIASAKYTIERLQHLFSKSSPKTKIITSSVSLTLFYSNRSLNFYALNIRFSYQLTQNKHYSFIGLSLITTNWPLVRLLRAVAAYNISATIFLPKTKINSHGAGRSPARSSGDVLFTFHKTESLLVNAKQNRRRTRLSLLLSSSAQNGSTQTEDRDCLSECVSAASAKS